MSAFMHFIGSKGSKNMMYLFYDYLWFSSTVYKHKEKCYFLCTFSCQVARFTLTKTQILSLLVLVDCFLFPVCLHHRGG